MNAMASQITGVLIVYWTVWLGAEQRKHQRPVNSPHKGPVTRKIFPFDDVTMWPDSKQIYNGLFRMLLFVLQFPICNLIFVTSRSPALCKYLYFGYVHVVLVVRLIGWEIPINQNASHDKTW